VTRSDELRAAAERVAAELPATATDVVLTGSTSRGLADEHSDIELLVVAGEKPESLPLDDHDTWTPPVPGAWWFGGLYESEFVELIWWTHVHADERVRAIAAGEIVDHARLRTAEAIVNGVALRGDRHAAWQAQLAEYPDGLTEKIVADASADFLDLARAYRALQRQGDAVARAARVVTDAENILRIVFALNDEWPPGWKRLQERLAPLRIQPERLHDRLDAAVRALDLGALRTLAAETLALAPQLDDVVRARQRLAEAL
jgi:hypothetical protein